MLLLLALAVGLPAAARADGEACGRLALRLATGVAYLRESWDPNDGNAGAVQSGWAPALQVDVGWALSDHVVVGGVWQLATVFDPSQSFLGRSDELTDTVKLVDMVGAFAEARALRGLPLRAGIALGGVASTAWDTSQQRSATRFGFAFSPHLGYDRRLAGQWSVGLLLRVTFYRASLAETPSSAVSIGVLPAALVVFSR